ncbi:MAG: GNAT family N-acetyltransferase [Firmicutes bacterium]|nr:GNAT family N-acetyltransferase [Bacillota bacterium]
MQFRKATSADIPSIAEIYEDIHTEEEAGRVTIGWERGVYPTKTTAEAALNRGDLFVGVDDDGSFFGAAIINQQQVDVYEGAAWLYPARDEEVMVLHTLVISPKAARRGFGEAFVRFYEDHARKAGCSVLRIDTNERNTRARAMYKKLGYRESDMVPCQFNGIDGVHLVLLEKKL